MSRRIVIDLSDLYSFLARSSGISGIQRFLINVVSNRKVWDRNQIVLAHWNPILEDYVEFELPSDTFDLEEIRAQMRCARVARYAPHKFEGRPFARFWYRSQRTVKRNWLLWVSGPLARRKLRKEMRPVVFRKGDVLLSLGAGWDEAARVAMAKIQPEIAAGRVTPIVLIHDLIPIAGGHSALADWKAALFSDWFDDVARRVDRFLVYSESTRSDLEKELALRGRSDFRVERFSLAHELPVAKRDVEAPLRSAVRSLLSQRYVLSVGPIRGRKNGDRLVEVWRRLAASMAPEQLPLLVLAGSGKAAHLTKPLEPELASRVVFARHPSDRELAALYENALFCVFPSLMEGWGLPIGEALWHGKLCLTSNVSSMPEVAGRWADYFDPYDVQSMQTAIERPLFDPQYRAEREAEIKDAPLLDWAESSRQLFSATERLFSILQ